MSEELEIIEHQTTTELVRRDEMTVAEVAARLGKVQEALREVMREGEHYGVIPGTEKPTLLKPGAELLCLLFRMAPKYDVQEEFNEDHLTVNVICSLTHIPTSDFLGEGVGMATSREKKYAYRYAQRTCPACGQPQVRKSKRDDEWYCWRKQGGCGQTWPVDSEQGRAFEAMEAGQIDNPDLPDTYNTILKMAKKRALVDAVLTATAASDIFTQDVEETVTVEKAPVASAETLARLRSALQALSYSDRWSIENVLTFASRKYGRPISELEQLYEHEAAEVIRGAATFYTENPPPPPDEPQVDMSDFEPPRED